MANYRRHHIGDKFGRLTLVKVHSNDTWECRCVCGETVISCADPIRNGRKKSCGCARRRNSVGEVFGALTLLEYVGGSRWLCLCECGNKKEVLTGMLNSGETTSCGCHMHKKRLDAAKPKQTYLEKIARQRARYYERKAEAALPKKVDHNAESSAALELQNLWSKRS